MLGWGVDVRGVGSVKRNIAVPISMPRQERSFQQQKITMIPFAVVRKRGSKKKTIVLEDTQDIVQRDGNLHTSQHRIQVS